MKKWILISGFLGCQLGGLLAQQTPSSDDQKPVLPPGPWPVRAPSRAAWEVHSEYVDSASAQSGESGTNPAPADGAGATPATKSETVTKITKTLPVVHEVETTPDGKTMDKWFNNGVEITLTSGSPVFMICNAPTAVFYHDYNHSDFDDFNWLSKSNFKGTEQVNNATCFYFSTKMLFSSGSAPRIVSNDTVATKLSEAVVDVKADINVKTLLPVQLIWGLEKRSYEFLAPPEGQQTLPPAFQGALDEQMRKLKAMSIAPPRST